MPKSDFYKAHPELYNPSAKEPVIVDVPEFTFLMIDGEGDPNTSKNYQQAVEALYSLAYTIKFLPKKGIVIPGYTEFKVGPLEGLWWMQDNREFVTGSKDDWFWTMMLRQESFVTQEVVSQALELAKKKKPNPALELIRLEPYHEGTAVQIMHIGPYAEEHPNIMRIHEFARAQGYELRGKHHELYFGDPRKSKPENLHTVLRQPVSK